MPSSLPLPRLLRPMLMLHGNTAFPGIKAPWESECRRLRRSHCCSVDHKGNTHGLQHTLLQRALSLPRR
eukprot:2665561-Alexandrium_andersonii.AAC.1